MIRPRKHRSNAPATETEHAELWRDSAACKPNPDTDPDVWYPPSSDEETEAEAKAVCAGCPVRDACLTWALDHNEPHGIWGGMTPEERRLLLRRQTRPSRAEKVEHKCRHEGCGRTFTSSQALSHHAIRGHATHCESGHLWTPDNTMRVKNGGRECRTCNRERLRALRARRKEAS